MMKIKITMLIACIVLLEACASSDIQRNAASGAESVVQNTSNYLDNAGKSDIPGGYENSTQVSKGAMIGGATGAIAGGLTSGVGMLPGAAGGVVVGGSLGALFESHSTLSDKIENRGGKVMVLGDQVMIVLPSRFVFKNMTADINTAAYSTLDLVADYINQKENVSMSIIVSAYSNAGVDTVNRVLTKQQADMIAKYLWRRGVNTRLLTARGMGGTHLVEANNSDWEKSANYRVEITLEKLPC